MNIPRDIVELLIEAASIAGQKNYTILMNAKDEIEDLRNEVADLRYALECQLDHLADLKDALHQCNQRFVREENAS